LQAGWGMTKKKGTTLASEIGARLRAIREHNGWTQKQLAERLGVTPSQLSNWELGKIEPSTESQVSICEELDLLMDELVRGKRMPHIYVELRDAVRSLEREGIEYCRIATEILLMILAKARQDGRREKQKEAR
jgi:transcriptional regulator with XRE-family HTH domain